MYLHIQNWCTLLQAFRSEALTEKWQILVRIEAEIKGLLAGQKGSQKLFKIDAHTPPDTDFPSNIRNLVQARFRQAIIQEILRLMSL